MPYVTRSKGKRRTTRYAIATIAALLRAPRLQPGWRSLPKNFRVTSGEAIAYNSSGASWRHFCGACGTGLYFINEDMLPGIVDIQSATLDNAQDHAPGAQIQTAERLGYMGKLSQMPEFDRYPGP